MIKLNLLPEERIIHVDSMVIRLNKKNKENNPVVIVRSDGGFFRCHGVDILGPSAIKSEGGTSCFIKTDAAISVIL